MLFFFEPIINLTKLRLHIVKQFCKRVVIHIFIIHVVHVYSLFARQNRLHTGAEVGHDGFVEPCVFGAPAEVQW